MVTLRKGMLGLALACALAGSAWAASSPVQVFGNWARGDLSTAHNASGSQYIGCWTNSDPSGPPLLYCEANDGAGNFNFCFTQNSNLVAIAQSLQSTSDVYFGWAPDHVCIWLTIGNNSQSAGRKP